MKLLQKTFLLSIVAFTFVACSKYQDGPAFSLLTKKARITNTWKVTEYVYEDGSSTTDVDEGEIILDKDNNATLKSGGFAINGTWEFTNDKEGLRIVVTVFGVTTTYDYRILRLKNKELWLYNPDDKVETHLVPA